MFKVERRGTIFTSHNQSDGLRPNEKMIRPVCLDCHGLGFAIDALADDDLALPLPAQMFRFGAEASMDKSGDFSYALLSLHPINKKNGPGTDLGREGLEFVVDNPGEHFYGEEELGGEDYFTAVYANYAVAEACATTTTRIPHAATSRSAADQAGR